MARYFESHASACARAPGRFAEAHAQSQAYLWRPRSLSIPAPVFSFSEDEERVRTVAETIADLGERITSAALDDKHLFAQFHLREEEERLARIRTGYGRASTAARLDTFLLPDSLKFAEYNGESPAGAGYAETLAEIFRELPVMSKFAQKYEIHSYPLSAKL